MNRHPLIRTNRYVHSKCQNVEKDSECSKESLRKKFASLYSSKIPTSNPKCPAEVKRAKELYEAIQDKMELSNGDGSGDDEDYNPDSIFGDSGEDGKDDDDNVEDNDTRNGEGQNQNETAPAPQGNPATTAVGESGNKKVRRESSFTTPVF